jgi:hypothetical protein
MESVESIRKRVQFAHRRLLLIAFLRWLPWTLGGAFLLMSLAMTVPKLWSLSIPSDLWGIGWLVATLLLGVAGSALVTYRHSGGILRAATEIDRRSRLKERVSSVLLLTETERVTPVGVALIEDAERRLSQVDLRQEFPMPVSWKFWLPTIPLALACGIFFLIPDVRQVDASADPAKVVGEPKSTVLLKKQLAAQKKLLEEKGLKDAANLLSKIERQVQDTGKKSTSERKETLIKLNDVTKMLRERQQTIGDMESLKKRLEKMEGFTKGPADRIQKSIQEGNFKDAANAVRELQKQLASGKLDDNKQREELKRQLDQLSKSLQEIAEKQADSLRKLEQERDQAQSAGDYAKAAMLQDQLDKMKSMDNPAKGASKLADQLKKACENLANSKDSEAAKSLAEMEKQLGEMAQSESELESLESTLEQLSECKSSMQCDQCQGEGCAECQGLGNTDMASQGGGKGKGDGMGEGQGKGDRPEEVGDTKAYDSQVRAEIQKGKSVQVGTADGANLPGESLEDVRTAVQAAELEDEDPLTNVRLPKSHREQVQKYFDAIREGPTPNPTR